MLHNSRPSTEGVVHPKFGSYTPSGLVVEVSEMDRNELRLNVAPLSPSKERSDERPHQHDHTDHRHEDDSKPAR